MANIIPYYINKIFRKRIYNTPFSDNDTNNTNNTNNNISNNTNNIDILCKKMISIINHYPILVHDVLSSMYSNVYPNYLYINIECIDGNINVFDTNFIVNNGKYFNYRYVYVRINIYSEIKTNHVNCAIIDNVNRYVLIFEPKYRLLYDTNIITDIIQLDNYTILTSCDIGFNIINRLQNFDNYCQTYCLMTLHTILENVDISYNNYALMLNNVINYNNMINYWKNMYQYIKIGNFNFDIDGYINKDMKDIPYDNTVIQDADGWDIDA